MVIRPWLFAERLVLFGVPQRHPEAMSCDSGCLDDLAQVFGPVTPVVGALINDRAQEGPLATKLDRVQLLKQVIDHGDLALHHFELASKLDVEGP